MNSLLRLFWVFEVDNTLMFMGKYNWRHFIKNNTVLFQVVLNYIWEWTNDDWLTWFTMNLLDVLHLNFLWYRSTTTTIRFTTIPTHAIIHTNILIRLTCSTSPGLDEPVILDALSLLTYPSDIFTAIVQNFENVEQ